MGMVYNMRLKIPNFILKVFLIRDKKFRELKLTEITHIQALLKEIFLTDLEKFLITLEIILKVGYKMENIRAKEHT